MKPIETAFPQAHVLWNTMADTIVCISNVEFKQCMMYDAWYSTPMMRVYVCAHSVARSHGHANVRARENIY